MASNMTRNIFGINFENRPLSKVDRSSVPLGRIASTGYPAIIAGLLSDVPPGRFFFLGGGEE